MGQSGTGRGVIGASGSATVPAVVGQSLADSTGVLGYSGGGAADRIWRGPDRRLRAGHRERASTSLYTGYALRAVGRVKLDQCAGLATIAAGASSVSVPLSIDLTSTSAAVATLQGSAGNAAITVSRVIVATATNSLTIHLTAAASQSVKVAWHVFG